MAFMATWTLGRMSQIKRTSRGHRVAVAIDLPRPFAGAFAAEVIRWTAARGGDFCSPD
jgi:hypothetical protein